MMRRLALWCAVGCPCLALVYVGLAVILGLVAVNRDFHPPPLSEAGVSIYLRTNGIHADVVLPTRWRGHDWSRILPPSHMRSVREAADWIAFGWGDRAFMLETPTWQDMRLGTSLKALSGSGTGAMHVEYIGTPDHFDVVRVRINEAQHARLISAIEKSFRRGVDGQPIRIDAPGYFERDAFYEAVRGWSWRFTCNEWVRSVLSDAGLPVPVWAPFERTLFWHLPTANATQQRRYSLGGT
jgi:uncharacterized protein (TIGR02117 family)